jgi:organic radical activating enzyme
MIHPRTLEITTIATCPVNCAKYCPQDKLGLAYRGHSLLSLQDFKRALSNVPKDVQIDFSGYGEPFLNPRCKDMILHAHEEGHTVVLFSTLSNITLETWNSIKHVPFKVICIHLPDVDEITKLKITQDYLAVLKELKTTRNVSFMSMGDIVREVREVLPDYKYSFVSNERAGNCQAVKPKKKYGKLFCYKLDVGSTQYVMLPDCTVTLCCMDYGLRHRMSNLLETTYDDLYDSEEMRRVLRSASSFADSFALCRTCLWTDNRLTKAGKASKKILAKMLDHLHLLAYAKAIKNSV